MFFMLKLLRLSKFRQLLKIVSPYADHIQNRHKLSIFKSTYLDQNVLKLIVHKFGQIFTFLTLAPNLYFTYMVFQPSRETEDSIDRKSMIPIGPKISINWY